MLFDRICLNNGIRHLLTAPYSPTTTGKVERLHKTMRKEFFSEKSLDSIDELQTALDVWIADYNNDREHQSLSDVPLSSRMWGSCAPASSTPTPMAILDDPVMGRAESSRMNAKAASLSAIPPPRQHADMP